jgi:hypothetical protein
MKNAPWSLSAAVTILGLLSLGTSASNSSLSNPTPPTNAAHIPANQGAEVPTLKLLSSRAVVRYYPGAMGHQQSCFQEDSSFGRALVNLACVIKAHLYDGLLAAKLHELTLPVVKAGNKACNPVLVASLLMAPAYASECKQDLGGGLACSGNADPFPINSIGALLSRADVRFVPNLIFSSVGLQTRSGPPESPRLMALLSVVFILIDDDLDQETAEGLHPWHVIFPTLFLIPDVVPALKDHGLWHQILGHWHQHLVAHPSQQALLHVASVLTCLQNVDDQVDLLVPILKALPKDPDLDTFNHAVSPLLTVFGTFWALQPDAQRLILATATPELQEADGVEAWLRVIFGLPQVPYNDHQNLATWMSRTWLDSGLSLLVMKDQSSLVAQGYIDSGKEEDIVRMAVQPVAHPRGIFVASSYHGVVLRPKINSSPSSNSSSNSSSPHNTSSSSPLRTRRFPATERDVIVVGSMTMEHDLKHVVSLLRKYGRDRLTPSDLFWFTLIRLDCLIFRVVARAPHESSLHHLFSRTSSPSSS